MPLLYPLFWKEKSKFLQRKPDFWFASEASSKEQTIFFFEWLSSFQTKIPAQLRKLKKHYATRKKKKMSKCFQLSTAGPVFDFKKFVHITLLPTKKETCTILRWEENIHAPGKIMVHPCMCLVVHPLANLTRPGKKKRLSVLLLLECP